MATSDLDLLRERRAQLGLPEPDTTDLMVPLLKGAVLGGALLGLALLASGVMALLGRSTASEVERLTPVEARADGLRGQIQAERSKRLAVEKASADLAEALVAVRSGSALMQDLRSRTPQGVQLTQARVEGNQLRIQGLAADSNAFERINALQLNLQRSPLIDSKGVSLIRASRFNPKSEDEVKQKMAVFGSMPVEFEVLAGFRARESGRDLALLIGLGADGMASRLRMLQREGVLR